MLEFEQGNSLIFFVNLPLLVSRYRFDWHVGPGGAWIVDKRSGDVIHTLDAWHSAQYIGHVALPDVHIVH